MSGTRLIGETNDAELIALMINRSIEQIYHKEEIAIGQTIVEAKGLSGPGFEDVSLSVKAGQIVGLYGLIGAGRSEFALGLYGRQPISAGEIEWMGKPVDIRNERTAMELGIALAPESRRDQGLCLNLPIGLNINLPVFGRLSHGPVINHARESANADRQIRDLSIKTPSRRVPASSMSGGNQQKIVIGKALMTNPKALLMDEPSRGIDVGAKADVFRTMRRLAANGLAILFSTSDLEEVMALSDRIAVLSNGQLVAVFDRDEATEDAIIAASAKGHGHQGKLAS